MSRKRRVLLSVLAVGVCLVGAFAWALGQPAVYRRFESPDGRFTVLLLREAQLFGTMPGDASGAPGRVRLVDNRTGETLGEAPVEMVQIVEEVRWSERQASIKMVVDWPLPAR